MWAHQIIHPGLPPEEFDALEYFEPVVERCESNGDGHHAICDCSDHAGARQQYHDVLQSHSTTIRPFLDQPQCNRLAKLPSLIRQLRISKA